MVWSLDYLKEAAIHGNGRIYRSIYLFPSYRKMLDIKATISANYSFGYYSKWHASSETSF